MAFPQKKKPGFGGNKEWKSSQPKEPKEVTEAMALTRLLRYCAYQERSEAEVRQKMRTWALPAPTEAKLIERLTEDNYLNEARFVAAFAGGKHRNQGWGKRRIAMGLAAKGIDKETIAASTEALQGDAYEDTLRDLLRRRFESRYATVPRQEAFMKLFRFAAAKGYEAGLITPAIKAVLGGQLPDSAEGLEDI